MIFNLPGVQEPLKNGKETLPGKNMQKNVIISTPMRKNMKMGVIFLGGTSVENSPFSDLDAFWLILVPMSFPDPIWVPKLHQMDTTWTPTDHTQMEP